MNTISITTEELEHSTLVTMHAHGMMTANEFRQAMDRSIASIFGALAIPWWEEPVV